MAFQKKSVQISRVCAPVRLRFPQLFEPKQIRINGVLSGEPLYSAGLVIMPDQVDVIKQIGEVQQQLVQDSWLSQGVQPPADFHWAMNLASVVAPNDANLPPGAMLINTYEKNLDKPPRIFYRDASGTLCKLEDRTQIFSGAQIWASLGLFSYMSSALKGGIGCALNLSCITGVDVGRFDGQMSAEAAFGDLDETQAASPSMAPPTAMGGAPAPGGYPGAVPGQPAPGMPGQPVAGMPGQPAPGMPGQPAFVGTVSDDDASF